MSEAIYLPAPRDHEGNRQRYVLHRNDGRGEWEVETEVEDPERPDDHPARWRYTTTGGRGSLEGYIPDTLVAALAGKDAPDPLELETLRDDLRELGARMGAL